MSWFEWNVTVFLKMSWFVWKAIIVRKMSCYDLREMSFLFQKCHDLNEILFLFEKCRGLIRAKSHFCLKNILIWAHGNNWKKYLMIRENRHYRLENVMIRVRCYSSKNIKIWVQNYSYLKMSWLEWKVNIIFIILFLEMLTLKSAHWLHTGYLTIIGLFNFFNRFRFITKILDC